MKNKKEKLLIEQIDEFVRAHEWYREQEMDEVIKLLLQYINNDNITCAISNIEHRIVFKRQY